MDYESKISLELTSLILGCVFVFASVWACFYLLHDACFRYRGRDGLSPTRGHQLGDAETVV